jgi:hypothetical protein
VQADVPRGEQEGLGLSNNSKFRVREFSEEIPGLLVFTKPDKCVKLLKKGKIAEEVLF